MTEYTNRVLEKLRKWALQREEARKDAAKYIRELNKELRELDESGKKFLEELQARMKHAEGDELLFLASALSLSTDVLSPLASSLLLGDALNRLGIYSTCKFWSFVVLAFVLGVIVGVSASYYFLKQLLNLIQSVGLQ